MTTRAMSDAVIGKRVLDACCGSRMFWFNRAHADVVFMDIRQEHHVFPDGRVLDVSPDVVADFRNIPYRDGSFSLVVFDPPHLKRAGKGSYLRKKYGVLGPAWREDLAKGFSECLRVLSADGVLIFKWNEDQVSLPEVLSLCKEQPLFGNRRGNTHWIVYMKARKEYDGKEGKSDDDAQGAVPTGGEVAAQHMELCHGSAGDPILGG